MDTESNPKVSQDGIQPCRTLISVSRSNPDGTDLVQFTLKGHAESGTTLPTYKCKVIQFGSGNTAQWIEVLSALEEIFIQNGLTSAEDQENIINTILYRDW